MSKHVHVPVIGYTNQGLPVYAIAGGSGEEAPPVEGLQVDLTEGGSVTDPPTSQKAGPDRSGGEPQYFTAEDIAKVRKEEKDKLYPRLQTLEEELRTYREEREAILKQQEEEEARRAAEAEAKQREELDAKALVQQVEQTWQEKFDAIQAEREAERAMLEKEREYSALMDYKTQRLAQAEDAIMPELRDLVNGNTPEEIDASIANLSERTARILEQARTFAQSQRQQMQGVRPTAPNIGPLEENDSAQQTVTPEQIKSMSMQDYVKYRGKLLAAASQKVQQNGLYGA